MWNVVDENSWLPKPGEMVLVSIKSEVFLGEDGERAPGVAMASLQTRKDGFGRDYPWRWSAHGLRMMDTRNYMNSHLCTLDLTEVEAWCEIPLPYDLR